MGFVVDHDPVSNRPEDIALADAAGPLPEVAREAIRAKLEKRNPNHGVAADGLLATARPVFVTLRIDENLRGCIGSLEAQCADLVEETMDRARAAAFLDPRFAPLTPAELDQVSIEVSILGPLEPIESHDDLDPARFGIEIKDDTGRRAVLLPEINGVDTVEKQIAVTRDKARIPASAPIKIRRFAVVKVLES